MVRNVPHGLRSIISILSFLCVANFNTNADVVNVNRLQIFKQKVSPKIIDNYMFSIYFADAKKAYNLRGFEIGAPGNNIQDLKINPAGYSFAMLYGKPGKTSVRIQSLNVGRNIKEDLKGLVAPTAICYMPDSRQIAVADNGKIKFYNSKSFGLEREIPVYGEPSSLIISPNGQLAIALYPQHAKSLTLSSGDVR